jgi:hypothetical protein
MTADTTILAIDPGNIESAYVILDGERLIEFAKIENDALLERLPFFRATASHLAIEMIASYGMPVGREVFDTCVWIGRFIQAWDAPYTRVYRKDVKLHVCGQPRAKDSNIRAALIDRWGGVSETKKGGSLYGVSKDVWAALAVAVTWADSNQRTEKECA